MKYYLNCRTFKTEVEGKKINEELAYHFNEKKEYVITHIKTGLKLNTGQKLKPLIEEAIYLFKKNINLIEKQIKKHNIEEIPTKYEYENKIKEFEKKFGVPFCQEPLVFAILKQKLLDIVTLEKLLKSKNGDNYNNNLSLKDNIKKIYGEEGVELVNFFLKK